MFFNCVFKLYYRRAVAWSSSRGCATEFSGNESVPYFCNCGLNSISAGLLFGAAEGDVNSLEMNLYSFFLTVA
jgi:hypothetical protein